MQIPGVAIDLIFSALPHSELARQSATRIPLPLLGRLKRVRLSSTPARHRPIRVQWLRISGSGDGRPQRCQGYLPPNGPNHRNPSRKDPKPRHRNNPPSLLDTHTSKGNIQQETSKVCTCSPPSQHRNGPWGKFWSRHLDSYLHHCASHDPVARASTRATSGPEASTKYCNNIIKNFLYVSPLLVAVESYWHLREAFLIIFVRD